MGLPEITVTFKKLAETASRRSARGFLCIILRDTTSGVTWSTKTYRWLEDVKEADYSAANYKILKRAFDANPVRVTVVRLGASGTMADAKPLLKSVAFNWICTPYANMQADLVAYIKEINTPRRVRKAKALVYQQAADDIHIVSAWNPSVTLAGESATTPMLEYLPRLAGILAACPMTESVTNYALTDLSAVADYEVVTGESQSAVTTPLDPGDGVDEGKFMLYLDDDTFRKVLLARIVQNGWDGTNERFKEMWDATVGGELDAVYRDNQDMSMDIHITGYTEPTMIEMILRGYIVPKPGGVGLNVELTDDTIIEGGTMNADTDVVADSAKIGVGNHLDTETEAAETLCAAAKASSSSSKLGVHCHIDVDTETLETVLTGCCASASSARILIPLHIPDEQSDTDTVSYGARAYANSSRVAVATN